MESSQKMAKEINILKSLNENDIQLLALCKKNAKSVNQLAKEMGISSSCISLRLFKLSNLNLVSVLLGAKGKKTIIKTFPLKSIDDYFKQEIYRLKTKIDILKNNLK